MIGASILAAIADGSPRKTVDLLKTGTAMEAALHRAYEQVDEERRSSLLIKATEYSYDGGDPQTFNNEWNHNVWESDHAGNQVWNRQTAVIMYLRATAGKAREWTKLRKATLRLLTEGSELEELQQSLIGDFHHKIGKPTKSHQFIIGLAEVLGWQNGRPGASCLSCSARESISYIVCCCHVKI
ncbi:hypothetical protein G7054_g12327 [Neopestalotiopsis clavispora]|nr:hypothetical protein G7054_g12327 [Neopestalotiopsis clavispora]